jgi:hypothetical protein
MLTGLEVMQHPVVSAQPIPTLSSSLSSPDNSNNKDTEIGRFSCVICIKEDRD